MSAHKVLLIDDARSLCDASEPNESTSRNPEWADV
jgi:hypothetical protein